jgi:hypothetical protein
MFQYPGRRLQCFQTQHTRCIAVHIAQAYVRVHAINHRHFF